MCVLHQQGSETLLATAGEDTTLRLFALRHPGHRQPLAVLRSHLSGVRALCLVEGLDGTLNNGAKEWRGWVAGGTQYKAGDGNEKNYDAKDANDKKWRGQVTDGTKDNSEWREHVADGTGKDNSTVWMVSAGGRAEFKVWQCTVSMSANTTKSSTVAFLPCNTPTHLPCKMSGVEGDEDLSVTCRELGSHMLRTGSHKTWRNQQLTFDPETRYMAAVAHWITPSLALVALASSDGFLRSE